MSKLREAAQQALEALEAVDGTITALLGNLLGSPDTDAPGAKVRAAITALRAALAQEQASSWHDGVLEGQLRERERWLAQKQAEPVQMHPSQFIELIKGKEAMVGVPVYWAEWPSKETT